MMSVTIAINGKILYHRNAVNISSTDISEAQSNEYQVDSGQKIRHVPDDGILVLARKLLDTIHERK